MKRGGGGCGPPQQPLKGSLTPFYWGQTDAQDSLAPRRTLRQGHAQAPVVVPGRGVLSYERGTL